jgi:thiol-disulfide isomerase/thioredoxin
MNGRNKVRRGGVRAVALLCAMFAAVSARAEAAKPFSEPAYREALAAGKTVVLDFHADWCGTCRKQAQSLAEVLRDAAFGDVVAFTVDFDAAKSLKRELGVSRQSTIVVFRNGAEAGRATGVTSEDGLRKLIGQRG